MQGETNIYQIEPAAYEAIEFIVQRLIETYQPERIVLFGSFAYGEPDKDSDIDLLVVKQTDATPLNRRVEVRRLVADARRRIPFSPLVITPLELSQRLQLGDPFYREIVNRGKVLYARRES